MVPTGISVSRKITLVLLILAAVVFVTTLGSLLHLRQSQRALRAAVEAEARALMLVPRLQRTLEDHVRLAAQPYFYAPTEAPRVTRELAALQAQVVSVTQDLSQGTTDHQRAAAELGNALSQLAGFLMRAREVVLRGDPNRGRDLLRRGFEPRVDRLRLHLADLTVHFDRALKANFEAAERGANVALWRASLVAVAVFLVGLLVAQVWFSLVLSRPLEALAQTVRRLVAGDTRVEVPGGDRGDEIGQLASALGVLRLSLIRKSELETDERETLERLRRSEAGFRSLIEAAPDAMVIVDDQFRIVSMNRQAERIFGWPRADLIGQSSALLVPESERETHLMSARRLSDLSRRLPGAGIEFVGQRKDGSQFPAELTIAPFQGPEGAQLHCTALRDISDRRRFDQELADKVAFQRALIDSIPYPIFVKDAAGKFLGCNTAYEKAFSTTAEDIRGKTVLELDYIPAEARQRFHTEDLETIQRRNRRDYELPISYADGRKHVTLYSTVGFELSDGRAGGLIGLLVDITERKEAEEEVRRSERLLQSVIDNAQSFVFVKDLEGRYLLVNHLYEHLLGRPANQLLGRTVHDLFPRDAAQTFAQGEAEILRTLQPKAAEAEVVIDGQTRHFLSHRFPLLDDDGRPFGIGGVSTDITDIRRTHRELAEARDAAEAANRAKSAFVATMSHEIRTPMNAIINLSALALDTNLTPRQRQYLSVVHSSARGLLALLNDILDFSKIEAGRMELDLTPFSLRTLLEEIADAFRGRVLETRIEFGVLVDDDVPDALVGDTLRIRQVLTNLLGNAFKFTERGEIVVRIELVGAAPQPPSPGAPLEVRFAVRDTGIGIPPDKMSRLFEAFSQADSSTSRRYGGTGLGLVISQRLVELMQGRMSVSSEAGKGSEFAFTARFTLADPLPEEPGTRALPPHLQNTRALVIEDSDLSRELVITMLRRFGLNAEGVATGAQALDRLQRPGASPGYDLVVVDWLLPDANGIELARKIRSLPGAHSMPVVMVSAYATEQEEESARAAGIGAFVPKPITGSLLLEAVIRATGLRPERTATTPSAAGQDLAGCRLLVAEDNDANQFVVREILERAGAIVDIVDDGAAAVARVREQDYDLVLMDMQMPEMDGLEATRRIRSEFPARRLPIIALTANAMRSDLEACLAAGMDDYVAKPIERHTLFAALGRWVRSGEPPALPAPPVAPPPEPSLPSSELAENTAVPIPESTAPDPSVSPAPTEPVVHDSPSATEVALTAASASDQGPPESAPRAEPAAPEPSPVSAAPVVTSAPTDAIPPDEPVAAADAVPASEPAGEATPKPKRRAPRKKAAPAEVQLALLPTDDPVPATAPPPRPAIDVADAVQRLGLPEDVIHTMLRQFGQGQRGTVEQLRAAVEHGAMEEARRLAHSLAGAAGNLSMEELRRLSKTVELAVKFQQGDVAAMLREVEVEAARVFAAIDQLLGPAVAPAPRAPSSPAPSVSTNALLPALEALAPRLEEGDLDGIQSAFDALVAAAGGRAHPVVANLEPLLSAMDRYAALRVVHEHLKPPF